MTLFAIFSFFVIMLTLAAIPSASVALVVARAASLGLRNGIAAAIGIVTGDLIFMTVAILGMSALATTVGSLFAAFKYAGGVYLIWLGISLLRSKEAEELQTGDSRSSTVFVSFVAGLLLTLGDLKAILFYASLFPMLMDVTRLSPWDIATVVSVTIVTVGGVKLTYAVASRTIVRLFQTPRTSQFTKKLAGSLMIGTGAFIVAKS